MPVPRPPASSLMLERSSELAQLEVAVTQARAGNGGFVLIEGHAGIGKTRLLFEAQRMAQDERFRLLSARGSDLEESFAFGLVRQLLESVVIAADGALRTELLSGAAAPAAAVLGPIDSTVNTGDFASLHGLYWLMVNVCADGPVMLVVDDMHWADAPSLRFLGYLLGRLEGLPLLVVAGARPSLVSSKSSELHRMATNPSTALLHPRALSRSAAGDLVASVLQQVPEPAFVDACYAATAGNPLLLREAARLVAAERVAPTGANASTVLELGPRAVARHVEVRLAGLGVNARSVAQSVAVMGQRATLTLVATHAGIGLSAAGAATVELQSVHILAVEESAVGQGAEGQLAFEHPLVQAAVYQSLSVVERLTGHSRAVEVLTDAHADPEQIAAHLMHLPAAGHAGVVDVLDHAARTALRRGSPDAAHAYYSRVLAEPLGDVERAIALVAAGTAAARFDVPAAANLLREAMACTPRSASQTRAATGLELIDNLTFLNKTAEALSVSSDLMAEPGADDGSAGIRLAAGAVILSLLVPDRADLRDALDPWRDVDNLPGVVGKSVNAALAALDGFAGDPAALKRARLALADDTLVSAFNGALTLPLTWTVLASGDGADVLPYVETALAHAHLHGSVRATDPALSCRGIWYFWHGHLADAEADLRSATHASSISGGSIGRPVTGSFLARTLIAQGRADEARRILAQLDAEGDDGFQYFVTEARARWCRLYGNAAEALAFAELAGRQATARGCQNPSLLEWRAEAALACGLLGDSEQAAGYAARNLELATRWGAPRALGRALRVSAMVGSATDSWSYLQQSVDLLANSTARQEYAETLVEIGARTRRAGDRGKAQEMLVEGERIARNCGASALADRGQSELKLAGGRPRRVAAWGVESLTPSERRVAELAARGLGNRATAERLYVTVKTVEVHLTSVYRKLGITKRSQLNALLGTSLSV